MSVAPGRLCRDCGADISAWATALGHGEWMCCPECATVSVVQRTPSGRLEWRPPTPREWFGSLTHDPVVAAAIATVRRQPRR